MGQNEVAAFLEERRKKSNDWLTVPQIKEGLRNKGLSNGSIQGVHNDLYKLSVHNLIECKGQGMWKHQKLFRAKK